MRTPEPSALFRLTVVALSVFTLIRQDPVAAQTDELAAVLSRAARYVAVYEDQQLGNLLVAEDYRQTSTAMLTTAGLVLPVPQQRRTQSDFLILLVGGERRGLRKVNSVDGKPVQSKETSFEKMMDDSPEGIRQRIAAIQEESTFYNIGPVLRQINVPTFALKVARENEAPRFKFEKRGTDKINDVQTWEIRFDELRAPTLVHGLKGESLLSTGVLWIEPTTGRIMKTEFTVENPYSIPRAKGRIVVTYSQNKTLGIVVPMEMSERYETATSLVTCVAKYSNFRLFNVEVRSEIEK